MLFSCTNMPNNFSGRSRTIRAHVVALQQREQRAALVHPAAHDLGRRLGADGELGAGLYGLGVGLAESAALLLSPGLFPSACCPFVCV